jgi:ribonuclease HII
MTKPKWKVKKALMKRKILYVLKDLDVDSLVIESKADSKYIVVAAASIVAKVLRDWEVKNLSSHIGDFGSGYTSDPKTISWLDNLEGKDLERYRFYIRRKWSTYRRKKTHIISLDKYTVNGEHT